MDAKAPYEAWAERRRNFVDALEDWPSVNLSLARLVEIAPSNKPRLYSIASSPLAVRGDKVGELKVADPSSPKLELCCGILQYRTQDGVMHQGLCSNWLANATMVACKVKRCPHMRLPEDTVAPVMCVCGGTGLAPFLGFLRQRAAQKQAGEAVGTIALYFGCRSDYDFLHGDELRQYASDGLCHLSVSFSRKPGVEKEYVYHALQRDADAVRQLLADGAAGRFYLCGSASTLAKDCTSVMTEILGRGNLEQGRQTMTRLQDSGRIALTSGAKPGSCVSSFQRLVL